MTNQILYVDDEPEFTAAHVDTLRDDGYVVMQAHSYDDALVLLNDNQYDLIILDLILPKAIGNDDASSQEYLPNENVGAKLHREIRNISKYKNTPIIFVTVVGNLETRNNLYNIESKSGRRASIMIKPCLPSMLLEEVDKVMGRLL